MAEKSDAEILSQWKREMRTAEVDEIGTIHFYEPPTFDEIAPFLDAGNAGKLSDGVIDAIMARVKRADSKPRWYAHHRAQLRQAPPRVIAALWSAIGGDKYAQIWSSNTVESAEKK